MSTKWNFVLHLRNKTECSRHEYTTQWIYFLFIYSLFNEAVNKSDASNGKLISVDNELERMWKEDVIAYREILFQHLPGETEENHENFLVRVTRLPVEIRGWQRLTRSISF